VTIQTGLYHSTEIFKNAVPELFFAYNLIYKLFYLKLEDIKRLTRLRIAFFFSSIEYLMKLNITHITCNVNDESDGDEIYLRMNGKKIWPTGLFKGIKTNETVSVDVSVDVATDEYATVELWEYDLLTKNDLLGTFKMRMNEQGGPFQTSLQLNNLNYLASYLLTWDASG